MGEAIAYARLPCLKANHDKAILQYICTQPKCLKNGNFLGCISCSQDEHREHMGSVIAVKVFLSGVLQKQTESDSHLHELKRRK
jgi:hypothetical protein